MKISFHTILENIALTGDIDWTSRSKYSVNTFFPMAKKCGISIFENTVAKSFSKVILSITVLKTGMTLNDILNIDKIHSQL